MINGRACGLSLSLGLGLGIIPEQNLGLGPMMILGLNLVAKHDIQNKFSPFEQIEQRIHLLFWQM